MEEIAPSLYDPPLPPVQQIAEAADDGWDTKRKSDIIITDDDGPPVPETPISASYEELDAAAKMISSMTMTVSTATTSEVPPLETQPHHPTVEPSRTESQSFNQSPVSDPRESTLTNPESDPSDQVFSSAHRESMLSNPAPPTDGQDSVSSIPTLEATLVQGVDATLIDESEYDEPVYDAVAGEPLTFNLLNPDTMTEVTISMDSIFTNDGNIDVKELFEARRELRTIFGWKIDYGKHKSTEYGRKSRRKFELQADRFIENCCRSSGGNVDELDRVMTEFYALREVSGWEGNYCVSTLTVVKAAEKRDQAEKMAEAVLSGMPISRFNPDTMTETTISMESIFTSDGIDIKALFQARRELRVIFGWKIDYGKYKTTEYGRKCRRKFELRADRFIESGCRVSGGDVGELHRVMTQFYALREDSGWAGNFGVSTMTVVKAAEKRDQAEKMAEAVLARTPFTLFNPDTMTEVIISMDSIFPQDGVIDIHALFQARRELRVIFGWKIDYGKHKTTDYGRKSRKKFELQADKFIENCCRASGGKVEGFKSVLSKFYKLREEFGWEGNYGDCTLTVVKAAERRDQAERKAEDVLAKEPTNIV